MIRLENPFGIFAERVDFEFALSFLFRLIFLIAKFGLKINSLNGPVWRQGVRFFGLGGFRFCDGKNVKLLTRIGGLHDIRKPDYRFGVDQQIRRNFSVGNYRKTWQRTMNRLSDGNANRRIHQQGNFSVLELDLVPAGL